jgi:hypothetical protein
MVTKLLFMPPSEDILFARGLSATYGGNSVYKKGVRAGFPFESSDFTENGNIYHDEWFADRAGGGQELIKVSGKIFTRVYAGGTISHKKLSKLGLTKAEVIEFLKRQMRENGDHIRLHQDFISDPEGDWLYEYKVIGTNPEIPLTTGRELIYYQKTIVFEQEFIICPVD